MTPMRRPFVERDRPSAMFPATRSWRVVMVRNPGCGQRLLDRGEREAEDLLDPLGFEDARQEVGARGAHQALRSTRRGVAAASGATR